MKRLAFIVLVLGFFLSAQWARAEWTPAKRLTWTSGVSSSPAIAVDSGDAIHVIWQEYISDNLEISYKRSGNGGTSWSPNRRLTWTEGWSGCPAIAIDSNDALYVAWEDVITPGNSEIYFKKSPDGGATWNPAERITWTSSYSRFPALAIDSNDAVHAVWEDDTSGDYEIYYRKTTDGGATWGAAQRLTWNTGSSYFAAVAIDSSNHIHVAWHDLTPDYYYAEIYSKRSTDGGAAWSPAQRLTWTSGNSVAAAIAIDSSGKISITYDDDTLGNSEVYYKRSTNGGATWSSAKRLTWTSGQSSYSALAIDSANALHVIWRDYTPGNYEVYHKSSANGGVTWSPALRLTWTSGASMNPAMAIDSSDTVHIVWDDNTPGNTEIYYKNGT